SVRGRRRGGSELLRVGPGVGWCGCRPAARATREMARSTSSNLAVPDRSAGAAAARPSVAGLLSSLRPHQWTKNLVVFAALVFSEHLFDRWALVVSSEAFAIFCLLSGVAYLVNDLADRDSDREHPLKRSRPIAAGVVPASTAAAAAVLIGTGGLAAA